MRSRTEQWLGVATVALVACGPVWPAEIFRDGFEECEFGRWSGGTFTEPADQLADLTATALANALGACAPSLADASFRDADGTAPTVDGLNAMSDFQSAIQNAFGTGGLGPLAGKSLAMLSTGRAREVAQSDWVAPVLGTSHSRSGTPPAAYLAFHGGILPSNGKCDSGTGGNDSVNLRLDFTVPAGATHLVLSWLFASGDYSAFLCAAFNDFFLAIVSGADVGEGAPADGNIAVDGVGAPVSSGWAPYRYCAPSGEYACPGGTGALTGTGFGPSHGATSWNQAKVPVVPGEPLRLELMIFDSGDSSIDSTVLLDDLRWVDDSP